jgi:glycosyltransferase involved in cell wall biosynthesis
VRIGIDIGKALGPPDGLARYARELIGALAAVDGENRYLLFPLLAEAPERRFREVFPELPPSFALAPRRAPAPGEVDLFHCTTAAVPHGEGLPLVYTLYDLTFLTHPRVHTLDNRLHCLRGLARALARRARLIAISEQTRRDAAAQLALAADGVAVIHPAAGAAFRPRDAAEVARVRERYGVAGPYVLSVGVREPRKNLGRLLEAFSRLPGELREGVRLALAGGRGWGEEDLEGRAAALGLAGRVLWLGRVAEEDLPALYSGAEVFAFPSLYEGFGLPPLEAMACGVPVVTSGAGSLPEVVGEAALVVDPGDADSIRDGLAALLADPERRRRLREAGLARAAGFSWQRAAERTLAVYRAAAGS